jgi:hypothetical protein
MLVSIYGEHLGPAVACNGSPDPRRRESPSPLRPNQTLIETQVFPIQLCNAQVSVGGISAGLLYVQARQINFKLPQQIAAEGTTEIRVSYQGRSGPAATIKLAKAPDMGSAQQLAEKMWSGLQTVRWETPYQKPARGNVNTCSTVPVQNALRDGLYGQAYYCTKSSADVVREFFYYPVDGAPPTVLLRRADFRLANAYPEMSVEVEELLRQRLTRKYGRGTVPDNVYEIGASRPNPGLRWQAGDVTIFLHRNRNYVAPAGIREGVQLIAVRRELLEERELKRRLAEAFGSSTKLSHSVMETDLKADLGALYIESRKRPSSEADRLKQERETSATLFHLLRARNQGERPRQAAALVAADDLVVRLGSLLVARSISSGSEVLAEAPGADTVGRHLALYGVKYTGIGHYSGDLEYDRSLLRRTWKEFPETEWGQRAFLMLQRLSCSAPNSGCQGPNCFREVIRKGDMFLRQYPESRFRMEQTYHLALAYETWWSLSQAQKGDPTAEGAFVDKTSGEAARKRSIELYEELISIAPESPEARAGQLQLPRLKLGLDTGERTFFCFSC